MKIIKDIAFDVHSLSTNRWGTCAKCAGYCPSKLCAYCAVATNYISLRKYKTILFLVFTHVN